MGNGAQIARYIPLQAINLALKDQFRKKFCVYDRSNERGMYIASSIFAGGCAGSCGMTIVFPMDFVMTKLQTDLSKKGKRKYKGIFDCMKKTVAKEGVKGLFAGCAISAMRYFVYRGLQFGMYDIGKDFIANSTITHPVGIRAYKFLIAEIVTISASTLALPMDLVRKRLIMDSGESEKKYKGIVDCFKKVAKEEAGLKSFYKGGIANVMKSLGSSLVLVLYDDMKNIIFGMANIAH